MVGSRGEWHAHTIQSRHPRRQVLDSGQSMIWIGFKRKWSENQNPTDQYTVGNKNGCDIWLLSVDSVISVQHIRTIRSGGLSGRLSARLPQLCPHTHRNTETVQKSHLFWLCHRSASLLYYHHISLASVVTGRFGCPSSSRFDTSRSYDQVGAALPDASKSHRARSYRLAC